jgi:hypothetical protein
MTSRSGSKPRHLASSPFPPPPEPVIEVFEVDDRVSHDSHGIGTVISVEPSVVTVDFGVHKVRVPSPFSKLEKL